MDASLNVWGRLHLHVRASGDLPQALLHVSIRGLDEQTASFRGGSTVGEPLEELSNHAKQDGKQEP